MKTFKTIIACSIFVFIGLMNTYAQQEKTTMDLLMQNDWADTLVLGDGSTIIFTNKFTQKNFIQVGLFENELSEIIFDYYLSDKVETIFDESKISRNENGKYIIMRNKFSNIFVHEIIKLSDSEFEFIVIDTRPSTRSFKNQDRTPFKVVPKKN